MNFPIQIFPYKYFHIFLATLKTLGHFENIRLVFSLKLVFDHIFENTSLIFHTNFLDFKACGRPKNDPVLLFQVIEKILRLWDAKSHLYTLKATYTPHMNKLFNTCFSGVFLDFKACERPKNDPVLLFQVIEKIL